MVDLTEFVGTWRAENGPPHSSHTLTWEWEGHGLCGRWVIEASDSSAARAARAAGMATRVEFQIEKAWLEDGLLLFYVNGSPFIAEFRLIGECEAVVGAAVHKLPSGFAGPEHQHPIERHRVRLTRQPEAAR